jgi:membrane-associated PAP2 superfamily phosphatase
MDIPTPRATPARWAAPAGLLALMAAAFAINRFSNADLWLTGAFFDAATHRFPLREQWFAAGVLHNAARGVSVAIAIALLALVLASRQPRWRAVRAPALFTLLTGLASAWLVAVLKHHSVHSCPWDLSLFGGTADYFRLLGAVPAHPGPGQCLPSGHASTGFMWVGALYAAARWPAGTPWARVRGWRLGWAVFALATSLVQVVRGAHFLSHVLIAAAVCWGVAWAADALWQRVAAARPLRLVPAEPATVQPEPQP